MKTYSQDLANIPAELRELPLWFRYDSVSDPKKPDSKPRKIPTGGATWKTPEDRAKNLQPLDQIIKNLPASDGIQFFIPLGKGLTVIDLDHCRDADTGEIESWAQAIVDKLDSYTEISVSGTGLHIVVHARLNGDNSVKGNPVEIFSAGIKPKSHLIALTGNVLGFRYAIENRQVEAEWLLRRSKAGTAHQEPIDWRTKFRAPCELQQGDVRLLIKGILPEGNSMLGASSGVGKTWFALSMSKALCTGEKFIGAFEVPERIKVLYLIPEQGDRSFRTRLEKMRMPMDGEWFRCRTMRDGLLRLDDPELADAVAEWKPVVFLDTAIRFGGGADENSSSENNTGLQAGIAELLRLGAVGVVSNHHISKKFAESANGKLPIPELESLRGSGDLGAMLDNTWILQPDYDAGTEYLEESRQLTRLRITNVKARDYECVEPFRVQGRPHIDERGNFVVLTDSDEVPVVAVAEVGKRAAALVAADNNITKVALAKKLGCGRGNLDAPLAEQGWKWTPLSKRSGRWIRTEEQELYPFSEPSVS